MPTVPRYDSRVVKDQALPGVRVGAGGTPSLEAFGGGRTAAGMAAATEGAAEGIAGVGLKIAKQEQEKADQQRILEERRALNDWEYSNVYDPKTGAVNKVGKDAFGINDTLKDGFDKFVEERSKGLASDAQKQAFMQMAEARRDHVMRWAQDHVGRQTKIVEENEFTASLESSKERGSVDPRNAGLEAQFIRQQTMLRAQNQGWGTEQTNQVLRKEESDLHSRVVQRMLAGNQDLSASAYFSKVKDRLDPDVATKLTAQLEEGSLRGGSQRHADNIISQYTDLEAAREAVRQIKDPKLRDATDDRVKMEFGMRDKQMHIAREQNFLAAANVLEQTKSSSVPVQDRIPPDKWGALMPQQRSALIALDKQLKGLEEPKHDDKVYLKYLGMPEGQLARVSEAELIASVRPNVKEQYYKEIAHKWARVKDAASGNRKAGDEVKSMFSDKDLVLNAMRANSVGGIKESDGLADIGKSEDKSKMFREVSEKADSEFQAHYHNTGKMPNDEQKKKIVDGLLIQQVFVRKSWFGMDAFAGDVQKPVSLVTDDERGSTYVPISKIPKQDRSSIENILRSKGKPVTQRNVEEVFTSYQMNDLARAKAILGEK